jgi:hypothetical protein
MRIFIFGSRATEDNRGMNKERDLLPWIFGGLSAAAIAVAFAAVSTHKNAPTLPPAPQVAAAPLPASPTALPPPTTAPAAPPAAQPDPAPTPAPPLAQTAVAPEIPGAKIWECTTQGVKTFSNNPCGEKATQLDVGPINTMSASPAIHYVRAYGPEPRYPAGYADQSAPTDEYADQYAAETGGNSYTIIQGVGFIARRRPEHFHPPLSSHNPAYNSGHNSGPVRRY